MSLIEGSGGGGRVQVRDRGRGNYIAVVSDPCPKLNCWTALWSERWRTSCGHQPFSAVQFAARCSNCSAPSGCGGGGDWYCPWCQTAQSTTSSPSRPSVSPSTFPTLSRLSESAYSAVLVWLYVSCTIMWVAKWRENTYTQLALNTHALLEAIFNFLLKINNAKQSWCHFLCVCH